MRLPVGGALRVTVTSAPMSIFKKFAHDCSDEVLPSMAGLGLSPLPYQT